MEVVLPASVREVGASAFRGCGSLKSVRLNEGLERLGPNEGVNSMAFEEGRLRVERDRERDASLDAAEN